MQLNVSQAPHIHANTSTRRIMLQVIIALLPTAIAGIYLFGGRAALVLVLSVVAAVAAEAIWQKVRKKPLRIYDFSAVVTGLLLGLNLPSTVPWWMPVIGSAFAIVLVKELFGGIGDNFLNPALTARAVLLTSWPARMTLHYLPVNGIFAQGAADAVTSATPLGGYSASYLDLFLGNTPGAIGEVCKAAILIGLIYLLIRRTISWRIPVVFLAVAALLSWALGANGGFTFDGDPLRAVLSGGMLLGAVFMATDYTTSPMTGKGQIIFAAGAGLLTVIIRLYGSYPEGVTFAILIMNLFTPLIDRFVKPKVYGEVKKRA
jgi:electron transport complex protein RnfD